MVRLAEGRESQWLRSRRQPTPFYGVAHPIFDAEDVGVGDRAVPKMWRRSWKRKGPEVCSFESELVAAT
jgi:hypothetical protein